MIDPLAELRAKYTTDEIAALGKKGQAFKNESGDWSYPIGDVADLKKAISAVGRGSADHDAIRKYVQKVAKKLGQSEMIPDNWSASGALTESKGAWESQEQRQSYVELSDALASALCDSLLVDEDDAWRLWVQDFDDASVVFYYAGSLYQSDYSQDESGDVTLGQAEKVRPVTTYEPAMRELQEQQERREGAGEPSNVRPLAEWRKQKAEGLKGLERRRFTVENVELRSDGDDEFLHLHGHASVTEAPYQVGHFEETVKRGAFKRTLSEDPDVQLLLNHEGLPLARTRSGTLELREDDSGLAVHATLDPEDPDVRRLEPKMRRGDIDEMSFAFQVTDQEWTDDYSKRAIKSLSLHKGDVSVVNYGANDGAVASLRSAQALEALHRIGPEAFVDAFRDWRDFTLLTEEERQGKTLSNASMETLTNVLNLVAAADEAVDEAQPLLAEFMGVPNPDAEEGEGATEEGGETEPPGTSTQGRAVFVPNHTSRARERLIALQARSR